MTLITAIAGAAFALGLRHFITLMANDGARATTLNQI
jgi:hypothetical protein|tara:strand:+ start:48 stop:158 length:111 start_codon:yes stop_codon:yes gene_type:complete